MEATTSALEDNLIQELDFKIKPGASYVTQRRNCSFLVLVEMNIHQQVSASFVFNYHQMDGLTHLQSA